MVARQNLNYSGNGFHGDSFINYYHCVAWKQFSMVIVAKQHLH